MTIALKPVKLNSAQITSLKTNEESRLRESVKRLTGVNTQYSGNTGAQWGKITKCHLVLLSSSKDTEVIYTNYFCPKVIGLRYIN